MIIARQPDDDHASQGRTFYAAGLKHPEKLQNVYLLNLTSDRAFNQKDIDEFQKKSPVKDFKLMP